MVSLTKSVDCREHTLIAQVPIQSKIPAELHGGGRFFLPRKNFVPAYIKTYEEGRLKQKAEEALELRHACTVCPRNCKVDRLANKTAACKSGRYARVASAFAHFGEEDCLRGWNGSGTIFFSWCNLRCVFCQNFETSQLGEGNEVTPHELANIRSEEHTSELQSPTNLVCRL